MKRNPEILPITVITGMAGVMATGIMVWNYGPRTGAWTKASAHPEQKYQNGDR
eukprot:Pgem_evm1s6596